MTNETFMEILRYIRLPRGTLLHDGTTYRLERQDFPPRKFKTELQNFDKMLILSDGEDHVVGGVIFYGSYDIQVTVLGRYRNKGYMSAIHKMEFSLRSAMRISKCPLLQTNFGAWMISSEETIC